MDYRFCMNDRLFLIPRGFIARWPAVHGDRCFYCLWLLLTYGVLLRGAAAALPPSHAIERMSVADGLSVQWIAAEPMITQPVCIEFDPRGRLWVIQYLQYPNPAGLHRAKVDAWSRTTYDRIPDPPPKGPKGSDRITILEDTNHDGRAEASHDFVNGLNLASGIAFGHGGVFVLNVPYLLFYPDANRDDHPDQDPQVLLTGFGMEDAHSVANSLTWGPDGWLYGCQGSTVTSRIRGIEFQQGVWRYHPLTQEFELFCEGGGNSWGLDFDAEGELLYSTNVGGYRNLHAVQGAYYWKSFGKHGALHNPYAFGYFDHIPHTNFTGGHVTDGGLVYRGTNLPSAYRNRYLYGDLLGHSVQWHPMFRNGSTFTSAHGGYLLQANDAWFAPSDVTMSPDGGIYVADWHDQRTAHPDPDADWDRSNGRIYRIAKHPIVQQSLPDFHGAKTSQLINWLRNPNPWIVRQARRSLADRRDPEAIPPLRTALFETEDDALALEYLWALHASGGFNESIAERTLGHRNPPIRRWSVRFLGDTRAISQATAQRLARMAESEVNITVRAQLAGSAKRFPAPQAWPILASLLTHDIDATDPFQPLLIWWAVEAHAITGLEPIQQFITSADAWKSAMVQRVIRDRLLRRWMAEGSTNTLQACAEVLRSAPSTVAMGPLLNALAQGMHDRPTGFVREGDGGLFANSAVPQSTSQPRHQASTPVPPELRAIIQSLANSLHNDPDWIRLAALLDFANAQEQARNLALDSSTPFPVRATMLQLLVELANPNLVRPLISLIGVADSQVPLHLQSLAVEALAGVPEGAIADSLLKQYPHCQPRIQSLLRERFLSRKSWASRILSAVDSGVIPATDFSITQLRSVALHEDPSLDALVKKHWGNITRGTPGELLAEMRRLNNDLNAGNGNPTTGRSLFLKTCAPCHALFNEGGRVGPDLTHANRADREFLLASIMDPSAVVRREFINYEILLTDDRLLNGVLLQPENGQLTLGLVSGETLALPQSMVRQLRESKVSMMPSELLKGFRPQEVRDLFSYLQQPHPSKPSP